MCKHRSRVLLTVLIAMVFSVAVSASDLAVRLVEYDCYGNKVAEPFMSNKKETFRLNCKKYSDNRWSGPGNTRPTSWDSGKFTGIVGNYTFAFTDRFNVIWSSQINVPSGYTLYVGYVNKYYNMLSLVTGSNNVAYTDNAFEVYVGKSNLDTLAKIRDIDNTSYTKAYNMGGYSVSFLMPRILDVGNDTSIYLIHSATGIWNELKYATFNMGNNNVWHDTLNIDYFLEYIASLNTTKSTNISPSVGAKLPQSIKMDKSILSKKISKNIVNHPVANTMEIKAVKATAKDIAAEKKLAEETAKKIKAEKK